MASEDSTEKGSKGHEQQDPEGGSAGQSGRKDGAGPQERGEQDDETEYERWAISFAISRSQRYCIRRAAHYEKWANRVVILSLLASSAVVGDLLRGEQAIALWAGAGVFLLSVLSLVLGWPEKARRFRDFYRRYYDLEIQITRAGTSLRREDIDVIQASYAEIERDEPKVIGDLMILCRNEECDARGLPEEKTPLSKWRTWLADYPIS